MSPIGRRPPPHADYPREVVCKWCGIARDNHCLRKFRAKDGTTTETRFRQCNWYPCRACGVVTVLSKLHRSDEGSWAWTVTWQKVAKSWFV